MKIGHHYRNIQCRVIDDCEMKFLFEFIVTPFLVPSTHNHQYFVIEKCDGPYYAFETVSVCKVQCGLRANVVFMAFKLQFCFIFAF